MKGPKNGIVKVKAQHDKIFEKKDPYGIYLVSVGKKYHEGCFLAAALEFMERHFEKSLIVVADTLQRHNYSEDGSEVENRMLAFNEGQLWLERNSEIIKGFSSLSISRWGDWLSHSMYKKSRARIDALYENSEKMREDFKETAALFLKNKKTPITENNIKRSIEYLKEECSIIIPIWSSKKIDKVVYPGQLTSALKFVYEQYDRTPYNSYAQWVPISFKRYSMLENA